MMAASYKLRCNVVGHEKDVRALTACIFPEGGFASGSRDITARIWVPNESDNSFLEGHRMGGHSNFIAAVCVVPPDDENPHGLIVTGSNDTSIMVFKLDSPDPIYKLTGHSGTVCSLAAGKFGTLLSGSWDTTTKVWLKDKCVMTLTGHEAAVWAVAVLPEQGIMLTGSADKTIKMWKAGRCEKTFTGHKDCVRGLAVLSGVEFLSCSNDASVKRWLVTGECVHTYYGHTNYIYSLCVLPNGEDFVTGAEDRTVKVWHSGECVQTIAHPTQSIWTVCCLSNGDIVSGASDGIIRVFTTSAERAADVELQTAFEEQVASSTIPTQIGDIKMDDLPGPEALLNPGDKDGQSKMVREDNRVQVYQWSAGEARWMKIGDVVGSSGGSQATSGKVLYEGQEYDYVFDVEIEEGKPPLKLPYNIAEDPWFAAQKFLGKNDLSQLFLDQVANFIQDQTKGVTLGQSQSQISDPFTGGGRYVPGSSSSSSQAGGSDPFTGGRRYVPGSASSSTTSKTRGADSLTGSSSYQSGEGSASALNPYFPQKTYLVFESANVTQIMNKVKEFNEKVEPSVRLEENKLSQLNAMLTGESPTDIHISILLLLLQWPPECVFPALDILRLVVRDEKVNQHFCTVDQSCMEVVLRLISPDSSPANQMLSLRVICNLFSQSTGEKFNVERRDVILSSAMNCRNSDNKNVQISLMTVLLNHVIALGKSSEEDAKSQCVSAVAQTFRHPKLDPEAVFRGLVCLGTLVSGDPTTTAVANSLDLKETVQKYTDSPVKKVSDCCKLLLSVLS